MTWRTIIVPTIHHGEVVAQAFPTPVAGLVIVPPGQVPGDDAWALTHERSGLSIGHFDDPESAQRGALALSAIADWTRSGVDLIDSGIGADALRALRDVGGDTWGRVGPIEIAADRNVA